MAMSHHGHDHGDGAAGVLRISLALTFCYIGVLIFAGIRAHSLALLSEAGHNVSDLLALLLSSAAVYLQKRPADASRTYGYHRAEVLAAFVNASTLALIAVWIGYEAVVRFLHPEPVQAALMIWTAMAGVVMNGVIALMLLRGKRDLNLRSTLIHQLGDTFSTAAVIVGGIAIAQTGMNWIDPALSFAIGCVILWSSAGVLRQSVNILLEGTPKGVRLERVAGAIASTEGVLSVHDLHIWSLGSESHALSAHVTVADISTSQSAGIRDEIRKRLAADFHIHHTTIQFECTNCAAAGGCVLPTHPAAECPAAGHGHKHGEGCQNLH